MWEWDGTTWTPADVVGASPNALMTYDVARQEIVGVERTGATAAATTWLLQAPRALAVAVAYGTGCAPSGVVPTITGYGRPTLGNPAFAIDVYDGPPGAPAVLLLSPSPAGAPLYGACRFLVELQTSAVVPTLLNAGGFATVPAPIPTSLGLEGIPFFAQQFLLWPGAPRGLAASQGLGVLVGV